MKLYIPFSEMYLTLLAFPIKTWYFVFCDTFVFREDIPATKVNESVGG